MGFIQIGNHTFGDPEDGSTKALDKEVYTLFTCSLCNKPADINGSSISAGRWVCEACHAVD